MPITPHSPQELAEALAAASAGRKQIRLSGNDSKRIMAGPIAAADVEISTSGMRRIISYQPADLTISVEAGVSFKLLTSTLAERNQILPLDPPFYEVGTVAGVVAANLSGPRRRFHGTARDFIIGMQFATVDGKLVQSGGMVVKNVAGLDMAKLFTGSWGTLGAIAIVNFKVLPKPQCTRTFVFEYSSAGQAITRRDSVLLGVLQPLSIDLLNPAAARRIGYSSYLLAIQASGSERVIQRYTAEFPDASILEAEAESGFWESIREFAPRFMASHGHGAIARVSRTIQAIGDLIAANEPVVVRGGNGVCYICFSDCKTAAVSPYGGILEYSPESQRASLKLWPQPTSDLAIMQRIKDMLDPNALLNKGRLYGRI